MKAMKKESKRRHVAPEDKRDTTADKQKIKKALKIVICVFLVLGLLLGALHLVTKWLEPEPEDISYEDFRFFEADYSKNILEDELYLAHNRGIYYNRFGNENELTEANAKDIAPAAEFFYDYFDCIITGDYKSYPSYFTQACLGSENFVLPERFTMQGLYDIHVNLFSAKREEISGEEITVEIYEVSYRIFENNGTFRTDILPDETRTLVFELYISNGVVKINAIGHRANG